MRYTLPRTLAVAGLALCLLVAMAVVPAPAQTMTFNQVRVDPLVSDIPGLARFTDPELINPWGLVEGTFGEVWVADNGTGLLTNFALDGRPLEGRVVVPMVPGGTGPSHPTGLVLNQSNEFLISGTNEPARLIVDTEDGSIAAWSPKVNRTQAILEVFGMYGAAETPIFKGLATARDATGRRFIFATDFANGVVRVFNGEWQEVTTFTDTTLPAGFAPFGIHNINGRIWVTFALRGPTGDDVAGVGNGFVDVFEVDGTFIRRVASNGLLNSPWGVTSVPRAFSGLPELVLIGNFGDGRINVFERPSGFFLGQLGNEFGDPLVIPGLWTLQFPNRGVTTIGLPKLGFGQLRNPSVFFTAGINDENDGLMGLITTVKRSGILMPFSFVRR